MDMHLMSTGTGGDRFWVEDLSEFDMMMTELKRHVAHGIRTPREAKGTDALFLVGDMKPAANMLETMSDKLKILWGHANQGSQLTEKTSRLLACKARSDLLMGQLESLEELSDAIQRYVERDPSSTGSPAFVFAGLAEISEAIGGCRQKSQEQGLQTEQQQQTNYNISSSPSTSAVEHVARQQRRLLDAHYHEPLRLPTQTPIDAGTGGSPSRRGYRPPQRFDLQGCASPAQHRIGDDAESDEVDLEGGYQSVYQADVDFAFAPGQLRRESETNTNQEVFFGQGAYDAVVKLVLGQQANLIPIEQTVEAAISFADSARNGLQIAYERRSKRAACLAFTVGCVMLPWVLHRLL